MLIVVPLALLIVGYQWMTKIDRSDPVKVASAFAKALKSRDLATAASFYVPAQADAWRAGVDSMKSGAGERLLERIPAEPAFTPAAIDAKGITTVSTPDKGYTLEMQQVDGKWYVSKAPV